MKWIPIEQEKPKEGEVVLLQYKTPTSLGCMGTGMAVGPFIDDEFNNVIVWQRITPYQKVEEHMSDLKFEWKKRYRKLGDKEKITMAVIGDPFSQRLMEATIHKETKDLWVCAVYGMKGIMFMSGGKNEYEAKLVAETHIVNVLNTMVRNYEHIIGK
jgi:hypothetical protein